MSWDNAEIGGSGLHAALIEGGEDGVYALDRAWRVVEMNSTAAEYLGCRRQDVLGSPLFETLPDIRSSDVGAALASVMDGGPALKFETASPAWPDRRIVIKVFPAGGGVGVWFRNVTRERHEEQVRMAELEAVYRTAPVGLALLDCELKYLRCNEQLAEFDQLPAIEHLGRSVREVTPQVADMVEPLLRGIVDTGKPVLDMEFSGGLPTDAGPPRTYLGNARPMFDPDGSVCAVVLSVLDITQRKRAEAALAESETKFRIAQELSLDGFLILRAVRGRAHEIVDFTFEFANAAARQWGESRESRPAGETLLSTLPVAREHPELFPRFARVLAAQGHDEAVLRYDGDGRPGWFRNTVVTIDEDRIAVSFRDVTRQIDMQNQLRLIAREMEHRGKNLLSLIQGLMRLTLRQSESMQQFEDAFTERLRVLAKAQSLVTDAAGAPVALGDVVARALSPFRQPGLRIRPGRTAELAPQIAVSLTLALHELATNAVKYGALSGSQGQVDVGWTTDEGPLQLVWRETGGPAVAPPQRRGLGSPLVAGALAGMPDAEVRHEFLPEGVRCVMTFNEPEKVPVQASTP